jgi:hypothetical protein
LRIQFDEGQEIRNRGFNLVRRGQYSLWKRRNKTPFGGWRLSDFYRCGKLFDGNRRGETPFGKYNNHIRGLVTFDGVKEFKSGKEFSVFDRFLFEK